MMNSDSLYVRSPKKANMADKKYLSNQSKGRSAIVKKGASKLKQILEEGERSGRARHAIKQKRKKRTQRKRCANEFFKENERAK